ncbi:TonB-dependent receptor [uncultured Croceicoccus sp.]|uniref:TonB-dependent receptor n=1 Tax=uncultured Croceicoccus sp. TaxID=1295329 RepID=UPI002601B068|nr:TonB-dependent receptor [uncultured Croceicoccus sp.]
MIIRPTFGASAAIAVIACSSPALAQNGSDAQPGENGVEGEPVTLDEIVVIAPRLRGSVDAPQAPVAVLDEEEIAGFGAGSIAELVEQLAPQVGSGSGRGGGRPVFLLNGQRVSSYRELFNYPPEAIARVEVLPEEVALRFGYPATQRVVNFILKDNFSALTAEVEYGQPIDGGYATNEQEVSLAQISGRNRLNIALELEDSSGLTEAERGVSSAPMPVFGDDANPARFRSLVADTRDFALNGNWSTGLGEDGGGGSLSFNGAITRSDSVALAGLDTVTLTAPDGASAYRALYSAALGYGARVRDVQSNGFELGTAFSTRLGDWDLTATGKWTHSENRTRSDVGADTAALAAAAQAGAVAIGAPVGDLLAAGLIRPGGSELSRTNGENATSLVTLVGRPAELPGGEMTMTLTAGYDWQNVVGRNTRNPASASDLTRGDANAGVTLGIPITSRRAGFLDAVGDITLDLSGGARHLSDFGMLYSGSAGVNWGVTERLGLNASFNYREAAPSLSQLGAPRIVTVGATVFDFASGQTVLANLISGGNPDLVAERQGDWKFGANYDLPFLDRSRVIAEYFDETSKNVSSAFPILTPATEAAFPGRVIRDGAGNLVAIDQRPVTFAEQNGRSLRYGFDLSDRIAARDKDGAQKGGRGGGPGFGRNEGGGRWQLGFYHTIRFQQDVLVSDNGPRLDLLDGAALSGNPTARHQFEMNGGIFYEGIGLRLSGDYVGKSAIDGTLTGRDTTLTFDPIIRFDARIFVDLGQQDSLVEKWGFLDNSRVSLRIDNIFDAQQRVTDATGAVPVNYLPDFLDPAGTFFEIDFRKQF